MTTRIEVQPAGKPIPHPVVKPIHHINKRSLLTSAIFLGMGIYNPFAAPSFRYLSLAMGLTTISSSLKPLQEVISKKARETLRNLQLTLLSGALTVLGVAFWKVLNS